jgi:hypothetical protein
MLRIRARIQRLSDTVSGLIDRFRGLADKRAGLATGWCRRTFQGPTWALGFNQDLPLPRRVYEMRRSRIASAAAGLLVPTTLYTAPARSLKGPCPHRAAGV